MGDTFTYVQVRRVSPRSGPISGGQSVTITGYGFDDATGVTFGDTAATNVVIVSKTVITATTPAHASGSVDVIVEGVSTGSALYTYAVRGIDLPPVPVTASVAQSGGSDATGGQKMQLQYQNWLMEVKKTLEAVPLLTWSAGSIIGTFSADQIPQLPFSRLTMDSPRLLGRTSDGEGNSEEIQVGASLSLANGYLNVAGLPSGYVIGDLLYADTDHSLARLADVSVGSYLRSGGVATAPLWSTLKLPNT